MQNVILICPYSYGLPAMQAALLGSYSSILDEQEERLSVQAENAGGFVEFRHDESLKNYYEEPEELELLRAAGESPAFFNVVFDKLDLLKPVLELIANRSDVVLDNDFGIVESGSKFVARFIANPSWDWLREQK